MIPITKPSVTYHPLQQTPASASKSGKKRRKEKEEANAMTVQEKIAAQIRTTEWVYFNDRYMQAQCVERDSFPNILKSPT